MNSQILKNIQEADSLFLSGNIKEAFKIYTPIFDEYINQKFIPFNEQNLNYYYQSSLIADNSTSIDILIKSIKFYKNSYILKESLFFHYNKNKEDFKEALNNWKIEIDKKPKDIELIINSIFFILACHEKINDYSNFIESIKKIKKNIKIKNYQLHYDAMIFYEKKEYKKCIKNLNLIKNKDSIQLELLEKAVIKKSLSNIKDNQYKIKFLKSNIANKRVNLFYSTDIYYAILLLEKINNKNKNSNKLLDLLKSIYLKTRFYKERLDFFDISIIKEEVDKISLLLLNKKEELKLINIGGIFWLTIFKTVSLNLNIKSAYIAREISINQFINDKKIHYKKANYLYRYVVLAKLEKDKLKKTDLFGLRKNKELKEYINHIFFNKPISIKPKDRDFYNLIKNKNIAIVGPVKSTASNIDKELDKFDIIIRLNYITKDKKHDLKTNSLYYTTLTLNFFKNEIKELLKKHDILTLIHAGKLPEEIKKQNNKTIIKESGNINIENKSINLFGEPNAIQRLILDIIPNKPKKINIFNVNLYTKEMKNNNYYHNTKLNPVHLIWHDIFSNFLITKRLYELKYIDADKTLKEILEYNMDTYASIMQENYGNKDFN